MSKRSVHLRVYGIVGVTLETQGNVGSHQERLAPGEVIGRAWGVIVPVLWTRTPISLAPGRRSGLAWSAMSLLSFRAMGADR
jgi:hypothetical protein